MDFFLLHLILIYLYVYLILYKHKHICSVYNTAEVLSVLVYIDILMNTKFKTHAITQKDIGIITPFTRQQLHIKHYLTAMNYKDITVGTVETFQGQERNVIILSTTRSKFFKHDSEEHIGFLSNPKVCY